MKSQLYTFFITVIFLFIVHEQTLLWCCTGIRLFAEDETIIYARTLEWRKNLYPCAVIIPRNTAFVGTAVNNAQGLRWTSLYAITGITINALPGIKMVPMVVDGVNEHGLTAGLFSFRDDIEYHLPTHDTQSDLAPWELITYILSTCRTAEEVKNILPTIKVVPTYFELVEEVPPLHYIVHDATGNCIVLEHVHHAFKIYDNPLGIITNSPNFDWHITHLNTYLNPSFDDHKASQLILHSNYYKNNLQPLHESYALGLPADFSSPSRFIRAAIYSLCSPIPPTGFDGILQAFHILNQFDIPKGAFRSTQQDYFTYTHWTSAINVQEKKYYFRTHKNQRIRLIDLTKADYNNSEIIWFSMDIPEDIEHLI